MSDFLAQMASLSRARAAAALASHDLHHHREQALRTPAPKPLAMLTDNFILIAEVKRASPSEGTIRAEADPITQVINQARLYAAGGASVISVLTEPSKFSGELSHAQAVAHAVTTPVMRKDFLVDPVQIYEARAAGCSGVLLIVRMLDDSALTSMLNTAHECGLFVLIESFDKRDIDRSRVVLSHLRVHPRVLMGVNSRDLSTLSVNPDALRELAPHLPAHTQRIAESGLNTPADARAVAELGYTGALVGTSLMRSSDPSALTREMLTAGRAGMLARTIPGAPA
jgi:indole-3-glycerol phosphate synthase